MGNFDHGTTYMRVGGTMGNSATGNSTSPFPPLLSTRPFSALPGVPPALREGSDRLVKSP